MTWLKIILAIFVVLDLSGGPSLAANSTVQLAQARTCRSWHDLCAARCKQRAPTDKTCVADHCAPKLAECRTSGCWQEGGLYGGERHCGLSK